MQHNQPNPPGAPVDQVFNGNAAAIDQNSIAQSVMSGQPMTPSNEPPGQAYAPPATPTQYAPPGTVVPQGPVPEQLNPLAAAEEQMDQHRLAFPQTPPQQAQPQVPVQPQTQGQVFTDVNGQQYVNGMPVQVQPPVQGQPVHISQMHQQAQPQVPGQSAQQQLNTNDPLAILNAIKSGDLFGQPEQAPGVQNPVQQPQVQNIQQQPTNGVPPTNAAPVQLNVDQFQMQVPEISDNEFSDIQNGNKATLASVLARHSTNVAKQLMNQINQFLPGYTQHVVSTTMQGVPGTITPLVKNMMQTNNVINDYFTSNQNMLPYKNLFGLLSNAVQTQNPGWGPQQVMDATGKLLGSIVQNHQAQPQAQGQPGQVPVQQQVQYPIQGQPAQPFPSQYNGYAGQSQIPQGQQPVSPVQAPTAQNFIAPVATPMAPTVGNTGPAFPQESAARTIPFASANGAVDASSYVQNIIGFNQDV
jgi:hypothetical protein